MYKMQSQGSIANKYQSISKFKSAQYGKFSLQKKGLNIKRIDKNAKDTPGPGSYSVPSEFGVY